MCVVSPGLRLTGSTKTAKSKQTQFRVQTDNNKSK